MSGLDNVESNIPEISADTAGTGGALPVTVSSKNKVSPAGKVVMDSESSSELLKNMETFLAERNSPMARIQRGLEQAAAWAVPNTEGQKSVALNALATRQNKEAEDIFAQQSNLATMKAAIAQQKAFNERRSAGQNGGVGSTGGAEQPPQMIQNALDSARTEEEYNKIYNNWAQNIAKERSSAASQTQQQYRDPETGAVIGYFTPAEWAVRQASGVKGVPTAAPTVPAMRAQIKNPPVSGSDAARVGGRESGNNPNIGYHDLSKGTAYGTYGITDAAYKDIQSAIPKFKDKPITALTADEQTEAFNTYRTLATNQLTKLGVEPTKQTLDLAHFLGPTGAAEYIKTGKISEEAAASNGGSTKAKVIADGILAGQPVATSRTETTDIAAPAKVATVAAPGLSKIEQHDLAVKQAQATQEAETKALGAELETSAKDYAARKAATIESAGNADTNLSNIKYLNNLVATNPKAFGVLQHPDVLSAIGTVIEGGANVPGSGVAKVSNIDEAVRKAMKGSTDDEITAAQKAAQKFSELQLNTAKVVLKGQGSVSDNERALVANMTGSIKNSPAAVRDILKWTEMRASYDKKVGEAYDNWEDRHPNQSFRKFMLTPEYKSMKTEYSDKINQFAETAGKYKTPAAAPAKPSGYDAWKKSQG